MLILAEHTGLSASMLSQLENGKLIPSLATLASIAMVCDVGLDYFFAAPRGHKTFAVVRAAERLRFRDHAPRPPTSSSASPGKGPQASLAEFPHRACDQVQDHMQEFLFVLEGEPHAYRDASRSAAHVASPRRAPPRDRGIMEIWCALLRSSFSLRFCYPRNRG